MTVMTPEEIADQNNILVDVIRRIKNGDEKLAEQIWNSIDERVLTEQSDLSPIERDRLYKEKKKTDVKCG